MIFKDSMDYEVEKQKLLDNVNNAWRLLFTNLEKIPRNRWTEPGVINKWSIKDILAHIHEWQNMLQLWHKNGLKGEPVETPLPGYKWNQLDEVNEIIFQNYRGMDLDLVLDKLQESHHKHITLMEETPAEAFFIRGYFDWIGSSYFKSYTNANGSGHYNWAKKHIRKWMREQNII